MKTKFKFIVVVLLVSGFSAAMSQDRGNRSRQDRESTGLNLTDDQKSEFKKIRLEMQQELLPIRNEIGELDAKLRTLTTAEEADLKEINKVIDRKATLMAEVMKTQAANHQEIRAMLSPEQRTQFDLMRGKMAQHKMSYARGARGERGQQHRR